MLTIFRLLNLPLPLAQTLNSIIGGVLIDVFLAFQLVFWPLSLMFCMVTNNYAEIVLPTFLFLYTIAKRKKLLKKSILVKNAVYICYDALEEDNTESVPEEKSSTAKAKVVKKKVNEPMAKTVETGEVVEVEVIYPGEPIHNVRM